MRVGIPFGWVSGRHAELRVAEAGPGLQFSLRDQNAQGDAQRDGAPGRAARVMLPGDSGAPADSSLYRLPKLGGLDIRV